MYNIGFVILNSRKAVMTTLGHTLSLSMSPDHVPANKAHGSMLGHRLRRWSNIASMCRVCQEADIA